VKITELFPKQKRVVGINPETGKQTAFALRKSGIWIEMMVDIAGCTSLHQLQKCRFYWAHRATADLWPTEWDRLASNEFDWAEKSLAEALAAQQAE
jgi:hypothetical protein